MKKIVLQLVVCGMFVALCACGNSSNSNSDEGVLSSSEPMSISDRQTGEVHSALNDAYSSPENAIHTFIEAVKGGEINEMTASFAIQDYIDGYNSDADDAKIIPKPTSEEQMVEVYKQLFTFCYGFRTMAAEPPNVDDLSKIDMESLIDTQQYESLQVVRIDLPETNEEKHRERISSDNVTTRLFGADGRDYRTALLSLNGETYYCGFTFAIYNGKYEIISFSCPMIPLDYRIAIMPCTEEEYMQIVEL